jgi:hypothetical protein
MLAVMRLVRVVLALAMLVVGPAVAIAKIPPGQGRACDAKSKCDAGLTCVAKHEGRSTCELVCTSNAKCPEDQRCVKDGAQSVCRPINDADGLVTPLPRR